MTITAPAAFVSDTAQWAHNTFAVSVADSYTNYLQVLTRAHETEAFGNGVSEDLGPVMKKLLSSVDDSGGLSPTYFTKMKCRDTSMGGNDAINCLWQFNEEDDVVHPFHYAHINGTVGMGRVYSEIYDDQQQIMYLGFGTPIFNSLSTFYTTAYNTPLADLMNNGPEGANMGTVLGRLVGVGISSLIAIPMLPINILSFIAKGMNQTAVTKYYDFKPQMPLYYRMVNTILTQLAINLGIMDSDAYNDDDTGSKTNTDQSYTDMYAALAAGTGARTPDYLTGIPDIFKILSKRSMYEKGEVGYANYSTDAVLAEQTMNTAGESSYSGFAGVTDSASNSSADTASGILNRLWSSVNAFMTAYKLSLTDSMLYIGFRVEKGVDTSESISNQTGAAPVKATINSKMEAGRNAYFGTADGNTFDPNGIFGAAQAAVKNVADFFTTAASYVGLSGLNALAVGAGMIDIPDIWTDSSFNKNYSFNMALRAPYGDPLTIFQSEYIPLACLLAGALPRAVGQNSYTSPFLCRAYCKGMFAVPLGIIDSINIRRGNDIHGWNNMRLPTQIDVSFSIKDLSPAMYMALAGNIPALNDIIGADSTFNNYLMTLSGFGVQEITSPLLSMRRRMKALGAALDSEILSPSYWGWAWGQRSPVKYITNILPVQKLVPG